MVDWRMNKGQKKRLLRLWVPLIGLGIILLIISRFVG